MSFVHKNKSGFTLTELIVVVVFVFAIIAGLAPLVHNRYIASLDGAVRHRGRNIFIAITGANSERESVGLIRWR